MIKFFANRNGYTAFQAVNLSDIKTTAGIAVVSIKYTNPLNCNNVWFYEVVGSSRYWLG